MARDPHPTLLTISSGSHRRRTSTTLELRCLCVHGLDLEWRLVSSCEEVSRIVSSFRGRSDEVEDGRRRQEGRFEWRGKIDSAGELRLAVRRGEEWVGTTSRNRRRRYRQGRLLDNQMRREGRLAQRQFF